MKIDFIQALFLVFTIILVYNIAFYILLFIYFKTIIVKSLKKAISEIKKN